MKKENVLLSYPRSGNHLCRFFIELLSELPTFGCKGNPEDIEIHKNIFNEDVNFNIKNNFNHEDCYYKYHYPPSSSHIDIQNLIVLVRNPREALLSQCGLDKLCLNNAWWSYNGYFNIIDFYNSFQGNKLLIFYEDMLTNKKQFINTLYDFLKLDNPEKKDFVLSNIENLYSVSRQVKHATNKSKGSLNFYYGNISESIKDEFDEFINEKIKEHTFLNEKYNL